MSSDKIELFGLALNAVQAEVSLDRGTAKLTRAVARLESAALTGHGNLAVVDPWSYKVRVDFEPIDLSTIQRVAPGFRPPVPLVGRFGGGADLEGALHPFRLKMNGAGTGTSLTVQQLNIEVKDGAVDYRAEGQTLGGRFKINGKVPSAAPIRPTRLPRAGCSLRAFRFLASGKQPTYAIATGP